MKVTTVNFHALLDTATNAVSVERILQKHAESDLVVFPEASLQGYAPFFGSKSTSYYLESAIDLSQKNETIDTLQKYADKNTQIIVIGGMERDDSEGYGQMYDTAFVFTPQAPVRTYRKTHLATNEPYFLFSGDTLDVFETPVGKIGVLICYDKCFCEAARTLAVKGAEIIVIISAWAYSDVDQPQDVKVSDHSREVFDVYDQVRAVENQCVIIGANQVGVSDDRFLEFLGRSKVVAPTGRILGVLEDEPDELTLDIDLPQLLMEERVLNFNALNILRNRRPDIYFD